MSTHPDSSFLDQLWVARTGHRLRSPSNNSSFVTHRLVKSSERMPLQDVDAVLEVLRDEIAIRVPEYPDLRATIARLLASEWKGKLCLLGCVMHAERLSVVRTTLPTKV